VLCLFEVKDREPKLRKDGKELSMISFSDEILLPVIELKKFNEVK
jgi:hypothetical protein